MQRYESYKPSGTPWLGDIPAHWNVKPLIAIATKRSICNCPEKELLSVYLDRGVIKFSDVDEKRTNTTSEDLSKYQEVLPGDFVLNNQQAWRGSVGVSEHEGIVSPAYIVLRLKKDLNARFANYLFRDGSMVSQYLICSKGVGTIQRNLYWPQLKRSRVVIPPQDEQHRIVAFLDQKTAEIDAAIAKKERLIELLNEQRGVLIDNAVTRGVMSYAEMHPSNLPGIEFVPAHWQVLQLKRVVETKITDGPHETPKFLDEGVPFVSVEAAFDGRIDLEKRRGYIAPKEHDRYCQKLKPQRDDIFFVKSGSTTGKTVIVDFDDEFSVWSPLALIRPKRAFFMPHFLLSALQSPYFQRQVQTGWSYGTQPNIGMSDLEKLWVAMPPISEQILILESLRPRLEKIDETVSLIRRELAELQHWKNTLIAESVTGKIKV